jgi:putative Holliday junction resolvase
MPINIIKGHPHKKALSCVHNASKWANASVLNKGKNVCSVCSIGNSLILRYTGLLLKLSVCLIAHLSVNYRFSKEHYFDDKHSIQKQRVFAMTMGKILALDIGDVWTGIAITDAQALLARPLTATLSMQLIATVQQLGVEHEIAHIVVGHPITMGGVKSAQTLRVEEVYAQLRDQFPAYSWSLWDERLSSKRAAQVGGKKPLNKQQLQEKKLKEQARAAAFILEGYLMYRRTTLLE